MGNTFLYYTWRRRQDLPPTPLSLRFSRCPPGLLRQPYPGGSLRPHRRLQWHCRLRAASPTRTRRRTAAAAGAAQPAADYGFVERLFRQTLKTDNGLALSLLLLVSQQLHTPVVSSNILLTALIGDFISPTHSIVLVHAPAA